MQREGLVEAMFRTLYHIVWRVEWTGYDFLCSAPQCCYVTQCNSKHISAQKPTAPFLISKLTIETIVLFFYPRLPDDCCFFNVRSVWPPSCCLSLLFIAPGMAKRNFLHRDYFPSPPHCCATLCIGVMMAAEMYLLNVQGDVKV